MYAFIGVLAIAIVAFLLVKSCGKADYEATAKDMKMNSMVASNIAGQLLADYQKNWQSAISDKRATNADGKREYCSDFNEAIGWRYLYYIKNGYIKVLDSLANVIKEDMKIMEDAPTKYKEAQKSFLAMYNDVNTLVSLVKDPKGSLMTFGQQVNELMLDVEKRFNETDLKISISDAERNEKVLEIQQIFNILVAQNSPEVEYKSNKEGGEKFMAANKIKEGVKTLSSGVQYKIIKEGSGPVPDDTSLVKVHYEGKTIDGKVFDSSYERGEPIKLRCNQTIKGWSDAMTHMPEGSVWEIYIPQELGYGEREQGGITPFSPLIFKVELIKVNPKR